MGSKQRPGSKVGQEAEAKCPAPFVLSTAVTGTLSKLTRGPLCSFSAMARPDMGVRAMSFNGD